MSKPTLLMGYAPLYKFLTLITVALTLNPNPDSNSVLNNPTLTPNTNPTPSTLTKVRSFSGAADLCVWNALPS